jgi:hypothetical protein
MYITEYFDTICDCCNEERTGNFVILDNGIKICSNCTDRLIREVKVDEYRKSLEE